jgi:hypothetical protein
VARPPAARQPDLCAGGDQLEREQHGDHLEHMRGAARGQRQRGHAHKDHEDERERALVEHIDESADRLLGVAVEPGFQLVAHALRRGGPHAASA